MPCDAYIFASCITMTKSWGHRGIIAFSNYFL
jgi:hypothetical protein